MKKHTIHTLSIITLSCILFHTGCNEDKKDTSTTTMRTTQFDGAQGNCTNGGVKIEVLVDGAVDDAQTQYICNGANGQNGQNGQDGTNGTNTNIQTTSFNGTQGGCDNGGVKVEVLLDDVVQETRYICNGDNGTN